MGGLFNEGFIVGLLNSAADVIQAVQAVMGDVNEEAAKQAADMVKHAENVAGALADLVEASITLQQAEIPENISGLLTDMLHKVRPVLDELLAMAEQLDEEMVETAGKVAKAISAGVGTLEDVLDLMVAIAAIEGPLPMVEGAIDHLIGQLRYLADEFVGMAEELGLDRLQFAAQAGKALKDALEPWGDAIEVVNDSNHDGATSWPGS